MNMNNNINNILERALCTDMSTQFIPTTIRVPDYLKESIESIEPFYDIDAIYNDLLLIGMEHLDELSSGNTINMIPLKNFSSSHK